jgi:hypothetical protein
MLAVAGERQPDQVEVTGGASAPARMTSTEVGFEAVGWKICFRCMVFSVQPACCPMGMDAPSWHALCRC